MNENLLIIFTKNPEKGKVKTRLAQTIGDNNALIIYKKLLTHTANFSKDVNADKWAFYSEEIGNNDYFHSTFFEKHIQKGDDLGEKMKNAFITGFAAGYKNIAIIGSDCYDLNTDIINTAFDQLKSSNITIGPALDGGYYLLGMNTPFYTVFENKIWSTESVFEEAVTDIKNASLSYNTLPSLSDVDYEDDLGELKEFI